MALRRLSTEIKRPSPAVETNTFCDEQAQQSINASKVSIEDDDANEEEEEDTIIAESAIIQGVKIYPSKLQFTNTYEGKQFQRTVLIQNCGPNSALVRYNGPTNKAFSYAPLKRGKRLSSGMKLTLNIEYTYLQYSALLTYSIPIFINDELFSLRVIVYAPIAKVSVDPIHIDFGLIDIGYHVSRRSVKLRNSGSKLSKFSIDMGSHEVQISVDPIKGVVKPYTEILLQVEISSIDEGDFKAYFTVQCERTIRVIVTGTVMMGKLEICNQLSCDNFTLIEFPKTYYGSKCTQRLVLRNNSASGTVFCVLFNNEDKLGKENNDAKCFSINPIDGRLEPREARIFTIE